MFTFTAKEREMLKKMRECARYIQESRDHLKDQSAPWSKRKWENPMIDLEMALLNGDITRVKMLYHKYFWPNWQSDPNLAAYLIEICQQKYVFTQQEVSLGYV